MSDTKSTRAPRSFTLDPPKETATRSDDRKSPPRKPKAMKVSREIILQSDDAVDEAYGDIDQLTPPPPLPYQRKGFGWGKLALSAFGALFAISVGLAIDQLIRELFSRNDWLGWAATVLAGLGAIGVLAVVIRELWAMSRLRNIDALRIRERTPPVPMISNRLAQ